MWKALTIDMGWAVAEWRRSATPPTPPQEIKMLPVDSQLPELRRGMQDPVPGLKTNYIKRAQSVLAWLAGYDGKIDGDYGAETAAAVKTMMKNDPARSTTDGSKISMPEWSRLYGLW